MPVEEVMAGNGLAYSIRHGQGCFGPGLRQDKGKLLATVAGHQIISPNDGLRDQAQLLENEIACLVTVEVINLLKVIDIG